MSTNHERHWHGAAFTIVRKSGNAPGSVIFHLSGPLTARSMFGVQTPDAVRQMFDLNSMLPGGGLPVLNIFDLSEVPYMDSMGLGMIVSHYARCQAKGVSAVIAAPSPRVLELFKLTSMDTVFSLASTVEEAEAR